MFFIKQKRESLCQQTEFKEEGSFHPKKLPELGIVVYLVLALES